MAKYIYVKTNYRRISGSSVLLAMIVFLCSWGTWGHQHINRAAIFALPDSMRVFYYNHSDYITEESIGPDLRKYVLNFKSEGPKHYIDIEAFDRPIDSMPLYPKEETKLYDENFLQKNGTLPWQVQEIMTKLTKAFQEKRRSEILLLSADLGHYLGDAHMPLHTSVNHDGQLTGQTGIHAFWESQLPEQFGDKYNMNTTEARYIDDLCKETWRIIKSSHALVDTLLATEKHLKENFEEDKIYKRDEQGKTIKNKFNQPIHSIEYAAKYHEALKGMVENQIRLSIAATANFWYTAWVNAGKPDLSSLDDVELTNQNKDALAKDYSAWQKGKLTKLKIDMEF